MDTLRVNVCYRPLRIGWLVRAGDAIGFRQAVSLSHALWGGRYNPILTVDREEESRSLIERFRVDLLLPASTDEATRSFAAKFPHLINPIHSDSIFGGTESHRRVEVLDVQNLLTHIRGKPERQTIIDKGFRLFAWEDDDPLSDLFLIQLGRYPSVDTSGIDYRSIVARSLDAVETKIDRAATVPVEIGEHPSIAYLPRHGLEQHHSVYGRPDDYPGFFLGHADNLDDLICFWNLRACDIPLWFVDPRHVQRYRQCLVNWEKVVRESIAHRNEWERHVGVWRRQADLTLPADLLPHPTVVHVEVPSEQDFRSIPPTMHFGEASALGVLERGAGAPKVSFSLNDKPFSSEIWFYPQRLVASIAFLGGLYDDDAHTLQLPYLPELNEFFSREMLYDYSQLRVESERIGVVMT